ncbi:MAG: hypothetical protein VB131_06725, partial [Burkholderia gladioli]
LNLGHRPARALGSFITALSFMIVIFAVVDIPRDQPIRGYVDFLLYSAPARFTSAFVMIGLFFWLFILKGKGIHLLSMTPNEELPSQPRRNIQ